jgi:PIN domain nuclease of toxin-antitoxin system
VIVLDTHAWFWLVASPEHLSEAGAQAIDKSDRLGISAITCWEIAMLVEKGRIEIDRPVQRWLEDALTSTATVLYRSTLQSPRSRRSFPFTEIRPIESS